MDSSDEWWNDRGMEWLSGKSDFDSGSDSHILISNNKSNIMNINIIMKMDRETSWLIGISR